MNEGEASPDVFAIYKLELKEIYERVSALEKENNDKSELKEIFEHLSALEKVTNDMSELKVDMNYGVI